MAPVWLFDDLYTAFRFYHSRVIPLFYMTSTPVQLPEEASWERLPQEDNKWYGRFVLYLQQGHSRYVHRAVHAEDAEQGRPPTKRTPGSWRDAAKRFRWKERAEDYDEFRRKEIFTRGFASEQVRVEKLNELLEKLETRMIAALDSMKPSKGGFPDFIVGRYYEGLDAIAKETGGRVQRKEVAGPGGSPLEVLLYLPEQESSEMETKVSSEGLGEVLGEEEEQWE